MLGFSQVLKPLKWQDLLEEGKKSPQCISNMCKDSLQRKQYFGVRGYLIPKQVNIIMIIIVIDMI